MLRFYDVISFLESKSVGLDDRVRKFIGGGLNLTHHHPSELGFSDVPTDQQFLVFMEKFSGQALAPVELAEFIFEWLGEEQESGSITLVLTTIGPVILECGPYGERAVFAPVTLRSTRVGSVVFRSS